MCNKKDQVAINVQITELVLTPLTCASLINEIIKFLVYQKSQIPYPYTWLQNTINKKRQSEQDLKKINFTLEKHYRMASSAYDALEDIMKNIRCEFQSSCIKEILILFGSTPYFPKEVFTIQIPSLAKGHIEEKHVEATAKHQYKILQNIFYSKDWIKSEEGESSSLTNMYIFIRKSELLNCNFYDNEFFILNRSYSLSSKVKNTVINLDYCDSLSNCCGVFPLFEDETSVNDCSKENPDQADDCHWYQAKVLVKGFKDYFINSASVSELW